MKFELEPFHRDAQDNDLLDDLIKAHRVLKDQGRTLTFRSYNEVGKYSAGIFGVRFGSWNKALVKARLTPSEEKNVSDNALFENLKEVWLHKGKQPVFRDMASSPSRYSASLYAAKFGSWRKALKSFVDLVQSDDWIKDDIKNNDVEIDQVEAPEKKKKRTVRNISERMRFRILLRDGFQCQSCGASPLKDRGVELHVDHILPWSKGGETEENNLHTKCKRCNLGKGNAFDR